MAILQVTLFSQSLMRTVPVTVVLPTDRIPFPGVPLREERPYKTLYLLHGILGSTLDWLSGSRIQRYAEEHDLAVVMPSGDNAFYVDNPVTNNNYGDFIGRELVEQTRKMFPLSRKREDTYIGGLSMGGYGALRNGLNYADTFGAITAFSSALCLEGAPKLTDDNPFPFARRNYMEAIFGDLNEAQISDASIYQLIKNLKSGNKELPSIYMSCGEADSLLEVNQDFAAFLQESDVPVTFETWPGNHEWDFWDACVKRVMEWLPLEANTSGMNSGNVGI